LIIKTALFLPLLGVGWLNRALLAGAFARLRRSVLIEVTVITAILVVVGVLTDLRPGKLVGAAPPTSTPTPGGTPTPNATCADLITQANQHYQNAQTKLKAGDLAGYAAEIQQVGTLLQQMQTAGCASGTPSASPRPTVSPSPTR